MLFSKEKAEMQTRIDGLEASLAEANQSLITANAQVVTLREQLETAQAEITTLKADHVTALEAKDKEVEEKVNLGVIDAMAAIGVPQEKLPAASNGPAANDFDARIVDLNQQIEATQDPALKGKLASQVLEIMETQKNAQTAKK